MMDKLPAANEVSERVCAELNHHADDSGECEVEFMVGWGGVTLCGARVEHLGCFVSVFPRAIFGIRPGNQSTIAMRRKQNRGELL